MSPELAQRAHQEMLHAQHILLIPHQHPDGDALGSVTAVMEYLTRENKKHTAFCATDITPRLHFLPHRERVTHDVAIWSDDTIDLIMVFDSGDLRYAGVAHHIDGMPRRPVIINIDHHATNEQFGAHNLVMAHASSTCEVLHHFFTWNNIEMNETMATSLLTGLLTDTDNFTNAATSATSLAVGHDLLKRGGNIQRIQRSVFMDKTVDTLRLWGCIFSRLSLHPTLQIAFTWVTQNDLRDYRATEKDTEGVANSMNQLSDSAASLVIRELSTGECKGSFRTTREDIDVSLWAKTLGGGGHKKAAGFTIPGPIDTATERVFATIFQQKEMA